MALPWERRENESARGWGAFVCYRDMGPRRSLAKVRQEYGKNKRLLERWSAVHSWVKRVEAWDLEIDRRSRDALAQAILDMRERHIAMAMLLQQKVIERLQNFDPKELNPRVMMYWLVEACKLERISRGEPGTFISVDVQRMSDEDLIKLLTQDDYFAALTE